MSAAPSRPPQVTLAAWLIMLGSGGIVVAAYVRLSTLGSLETRDAVASFLTESPGDKLGLGVDTALDLIRILTLVAAACATAALILGREVMTRSRSARVVLSVLAGPLLLTGRTTGGFLPAVVASAVVVLWLRPSRDWFNGVAPPPAPTRAPAAHKTPPTWPPPLPQAPSSPEAGQQVGQPVGQPVGQQAGTGVGPPPAAAPFGVAAVPPPYLSPLPAQPRPPAVTWAAGLTWAASGLVAVGSAVAVLVLALDSGPFFDELHRQEPDLEAQGVSDTMVAVTLYVLCGALLVWCAAASVVAGLLWRRRRWARLALLVSSGCAGGLLVVGSFASFVLAIPLLACVATFVLLRRSEVDRWL